MRRESRKGQRKKTRNWTLPTVLSLVLGVLGAVGIIELRPQIAVFPEEQLETGQPLTAPFRIDNVGYFPFQVERVVLYARLIKTRTITLTHYIASEDEWNHQTLERGGGETIMPRILSSGDPPQEGDIAIVVIYKPWKSFPKASRQYFRFKRSRRPPTEVWRWEKQPIAELKTEVDQVIDKMR